MTDSGSVPGTGASADGSGGASAGSDAASGPRSGSASDSGSASGSGSGSGARAGLGAGFGAPPPEWTVPGYEVGRRIGSGASGRVFLGRHVETDLPVAIKYLKRSLLRSPGFRAAYRAEAQLLAELDSPHVARLYEYVETDDGAAIVMEAVEGVSLRALLRDEGAAATPEAALTVLKGSLLGLAAAHELGVVHRDYKPDNVLITPDGQSKLVDFGIAARVGEEAAAAGSPLYMAPEQFGGGGASPSADVYSATATFFECVTGASPYTGDTMLELMAQHTEAPIPDELAPEPVRPLIRAGLAKDPAQRPPTAAALVQQLEALAVAEYGEDWEERGRRALAALIAVLPLFLIASPGMVPSGTTALATTKLGSGAGGGSAGPGASGLSRAARIVRHSRRAKVVAAVTAGLVVAGGITAVASSSGGHGGHKSAGHGPSSAAAAPTLAGSLGGGAPTPSAAPSPAPSSSASPTTTPSGTDSPSAPASAGKPTGATPSGSTTTAPATHPTQGPTTQPAPPPTLTVEKLSITSLTCWARAGLSGVVDVETDGAAAGTLTFDWYFPSAAGSSSGSTVGTTTEKLAKGQTQASFTEDFDFEDLPNSDVEWGLRVYTSPAAANGEPYQTVLGPGCEVQ